MNLLDHTRRPDITFCRKRGIIRIAARVARALALTPGDSINIAVECSHNCNHVEYLLYAIHHANSIGRHEAQCYPTKKGSGNYCTYSVRLCRSLLDSVGIKTEKAAYMVGEPIFKGGTTYLPIITLRPL